MLCRGHSTSKGMRGENTVCFRNTKRYSVDGVKTTCQEMKLKPVHRGPCFDKICFILDGHFILGCSLESHTHRSRKDCGDEVFFN